MLIEGDLNHPLMLTKLSGKLGENRREARYVMHPVRALLGYRPDGLAAGPDANPVPDTRGIPAGFPRIPVAPPR